MPPPLTGTENSMKNTLTASIEFYFKGENLSTHIELDLDEYMNSKGRIPDLHPMLARSMNLDPYSYEYEMMQAEPVRFSKAQGLAAEHTKDGVLNVTAFESSWHEQKQYEKCQEIAIKHLNINDLKEHPNVKDALLDAYRQGLASQ